VPAAETIIAGFLVVTIVASIIARRIRIPYTQFLVILGVALATFSASSVFGVDMIFNNLIGGGYFVALILPPLLFEAMMNVRSSELRTVIRPAISLATIGVIIATIVGGLLLWTLAALPLSTAFLFAALIAPTDTATVLEIFRRVKVPSRLSALLETEAAFNDATGIVVFSVVLTAVTVSRPSIFDAAGEFTLLLGGGAVVGLLVAFGTELLSSFVDDSRSETIITIVCVYGSYSLATYLGVSGLVAVAVAGLYFGNLTMNTTLVVRARGTVRSFWEIVAFVANSVAFLFIGLSTDVFQLAAGALAILVAFLAVTLARAASVYPILGLFSNTSERIPSAWRNVAMLGGVRGALSIVLLASIPSSVGQRDTIVTMVLGVAFLSITLQGSLLYRYAGSKFPSRRRAVRSESDAKLSATLAEIEELRKARQVGAIPEEEFATRLDQKEKQIAQVVEEMKMKNQTAKVLRSRGRGLVSLFRRRPKHKKAG
jgi:CPA1 family monovalent cation:H+ antiporter